MYANEIEKGHVEGYGGFQMIETLAESKAQARETAQMRPNAQIGAFDVRSADSCFVRVSADYYGDRRRDFRWFIPVRGVSALRSVELDELREVNVRSKVFFDGGNVTAESVSRKLETARNPLAQIADEVIGARSLALGDEIGQNHFRVAINRHPNVSVSPLHRRTRTQVPFLGVNERPEFIGLHKTRTNTTNAGIKKSAALVASGQKNRKNRALIDSSNARHSANAHTFEQERYDLRDLGRFRVVGSDALARLRKRRPATKTAITLDSAFSTKSEALRSGVLASQARHGLLFLREKPYNQSLGFECGLRPLLNSALSVALTTDRALNFGVTGGDWTLASRLQIECSTGLSYGHHIGARVMSTRSETLSLFPFYRISPVQHLFQGLQPGYWLLVGHRFEFGSGLEFFLVVFRSTNNQFFSFDHAPHACVDTG
jgi:hypothetical protein